MKKSDQLKQERASKLEEINSLIQTRKTEKRDFSEDETTKFDALETEIGVLDEKIERELKIEAAEKRAAENGAGESQKPKGEGGEEKEKRSLLQRVSISKALRSVSKNQPLSGAEKEMNDLAIEENRAAGVATPEDAALSIPMSFLRATAQTVSEDSGNYGGNLVNDYAPRVQMPFAPKSILEELGVTILSGLTGGDVPLPVFANYTFQWLAETAAITPQKQLISPATLSPKRLGAAVEISNRLLIQSSVDVENIIKRLLLNGYENAISAAAINGSGASNQPLGILNNTAVPDAAATTAVIPTKAHAAELVQMVLSANSTTDRLKFLGSPMGQYLLSTTKLDTGSGMFLMDDPNRLIGYPFVSTSHVPQLTDDTDVNSVLIFGDWAQMFVGQWGSMSILTDPYSTSLNNSVRLVVNGHADVAIAQPTAFAVNKFLNAAPAA